MISGFVLVRLISEREPVTINEKFCKSFVSAPLCETVTRYSPEAAAISIFSYGSTKLSPNSFVFTEVNFQGKNVVVSPSITCVTLISKSLTSAGVASLTPLVFCSPATSVHEIEATKGFIPSDFTFIMNVSSLFKVSSFTTLAKPALLIVSTANFVFNKPQPVVASGPINDCEGEEELSGVISSAV